jgi:hypothetical protein
MHLAAGRQPHSNNQDGKKIDGKKMGQAGSRTLADLSAADFFAMRS